MSTRLLPITRRGQFFEDDFFKDFQQDYSSAISDVLDRWGGRALLADQFANYRKARQDVTVPDDDTSLTASISDTPESYVIVLDMTEFVNGEISVRTRGRNAVVDAKVGNTRKFHRAYPLPSNTNSDSVSAAMSDDGILTITAKRKVVPVQIAEEASSTQETQPQNYISSLKIDVGQSDEKSSASPPMSPSLEAKVNKQSSVESESGETYRTLNISKRGQFFKDKFFENVWKDFDQAMEEMVMRQKVRQEQRQEERMRREQARKEVLQKMMQEQEEQRKQLMAARLERHKKASQEMQEQLRMFHAPVSDRFRSYQSLRSWTGGEDSQASTITSDDATYRVVLDVKDFIDSQLDLKSDGEVITVTGCKGGITFKREFELPNLGSPELIKASLSEDGVLTITAPKKRNLT